MAPPRVGRAVAAAAAALAFGGLGLGASSLASSTLQEEEALRDALTAGDECSADDEACALNELQLRAGRRQEQTAEAHLHHKASSAGKEHDGRWSVWPWNWFGGGGGGSGSGLKKPLYCNQDQFKDTLLCSNTTCACQAYCATSDKNWWGTDPQCCACDSNALLQTEKSVAEQLAKRTVKNPAFCQYLPDDVTPPMCSSGYGCQCQEFCKTDVAPVAWAWDANCCKCEQPRDADDADDSEGATLLQAGTSTMSHPLYCQNVGSENSPWCQGENTCACQAYCQLSVPPANWGWDPNCCGCPGSANINVTGAPVTNGAAPGGPAAAPGAPATAPVAGGGAGAVYMALKHPVYCQTSPIMAQISPYCMGENTCECMPYCKASVMPANWGYDPNCCGCSTGSPLSIGGKAGDAIDEVPKHGLTHPLYCDGLLRSGVYSPWCVGADTCSCQAYCSVWTVPSSWGWDPECCACDAVDKENAPSTGAVPVGPGAPAPAAEPIVVGPLKHPSYCTKLPPGTVLQWCQGENTCACQTYCKMSVQPLNWGSDPQCCGCSTEGTPVTAPGEDGAAPVVPAAGAPAAPAAGATPTEYGPLKHPKYCDSISSGQAQPAWCVGENTCKCETYCTLSVAPANWGWDPNCCGCSTEQAHVEASAKVVVNGSPPPAEAAAAAATEAAPAPAALLAKQGRDIPAYCAYLGEADRPEACITGQGGCACASFCEASIPPSTFQWNPMCCGCPA